MSSTAGPRVGRPRRYDEETERSLLMDAGLRALERNGYLDVSVSDIVQEAGVSRRAFYRHFDSKDSLVKALFRRDTDLSIRRLDGAVEGARTGIEGLDAWLAEFLGLFTRPRRAARTRFMDSDVIRRTEGIDAELRRVEELLSGSLARTIARGVAEGSLSSDDPLGDAVLVLVVAERVGRRLLDSPRLRQVDGIATIKRFCWPALGLPPSG